MTRTAFVRRFRYFLHDESDNFRRAAIKSHKNLARRIVASLLACNCEQKATALMTVTRALLMGSSIILNDICRSCAFVHAGYFFVYARRTQ